MNMLRTLKAAVNGIAYTIKNERNMRFHTVAAMYVLIFSIFFSLSCLKYIVLVLIIGLVFMAEMLNSSIEGLIDLCSKEYNATAKAAKDIAAGGVLVVCGVALISGVLLFNDLKSYWKMWTFFYSHPVCTLTFIISILFSYFYILLGPVEIKNKIKNAWRKIKQNKSKITD